MEFVVIFIKIRHQKGRKGRIKNFFLIAEQGLEGAGWPGNHETTQG